MDTLRKRITLKMFSLRPPNLARCTRSEIRAYFENSYELYEMLFSSITDEEYFYRSPDRLRLPLIFYLAHTATLYVNKMLLAGLIKERIDQHFEALFETGVNEMSWDDTENYRLGGAFKWPSLQEVMDYRRKVHDLVVMVIETAPLVLPVTQDHPWWAVIMSIEHDRIHLETSSVLLRQLPVEYLKCPDNWKYAPVEADIPAGRNSLITVSERTVEFGKPRDHPTFGWDLEYGNAVMHVPAFEASKYKVTNGEFLEFVNSGGYHRRELWTDEGWRWCQSRQAKHPTFWVCDERCKSGCGSILASYSHCTLSSSNSSRTTINYKYRAIFDVIPMPFDWPVDVNYHEAKAYCQWKGPEYRLPTEAEIHCIRADEAITTEYECDPFCTGVSEANNNLTYCSSSAVNQYPANSLGFYDTYGNVWEYIEDQYNGLPGFHSHYLYEDFSITSFTGLYVMMLGGSWASTGGQGQRFYRVGFRRHFFQHMGFRVARSLTQQPIPVRLCRSDVFVLGLGTPDNSVTLPSQVTEKHWVETMNQLDKFDRLDVCQKMLTTELGKEIDYGKPLVKFCTELQELPRTPQRAIVLGCAGGYTTFLLSEVFSQVVGVDYSGRLIDAALQLQSNQEVVWAASDGETTQWSMKLPECVSRNSMDSVVFKQLTWIPNEIKECDLVLFEFIDRVAEPKSWLLKLCECVTSRGVVVFSASECWTPQTLQEHIGEWFDLLEETHICNKRVSAWQLKATY